MKRIPFHDLLFRFFFFLLVLLPALCPALDVDIPDDLKDDRNLPREERIQRHQKRVQLILEARKKAKEEERLKKLKEARKKATESKAPSRNVSEKEEVEKPPPASFAPASSNVLAHTILHFYPFDKTVIAGKNFLTDMELFNLDRQDIQELKVRITFDPRFLHPVMVNDSEINSLMSEPPEYHVDIVNGYIDYACKFMQPLPLDGFNLLRIVWNAAKPTDFCEISFDLSNEKTLVISQGEDILGIPTSPDDGIIPTGITIKSSSKKGEDKILFDPALARAKRGMLPELQEGNVSLKLHCDKRRIPVGKTFEVSVFISNPEAVIFDNLSLLIQFDPAVLRVIDWDKRNWISQGINIHDGFARDKFPFDYHLRNRANNQSGTIDYRMGFSRLDPLPTGELARIRFQAMAPVENSEITFDHYSASRYPNTSVRAMGRDVLSPEQWVDPLLKGIRIGVYD